MFWNVQIRHFYSDRVWEDVIFYFVYYEVFLKVISGIVLDTKSKFCMQSKMTIFNVSE